MSYVTLPDHSFNNSETEHIPIYQIQPKDNVACIMHVGNVHPDYAGDIEITTIEDKYKLTEMIYTHDDLESVVDYTLPVYRCTVGVGSCLVLSFHTFDFKENSIMNYLSTKDDVKTLKGYFSVTFYHKNKKMLLKTYKSFTNFNDMMTQLIGFIYEPFIEELIETSNK